MYITGILRHSKLGNNLKLCHMFVGDASALSCSLSLSHTHRHTYTQTHTHTRTHRKKSEATIKVYSSSNLWELWFYHLVFMTHTCLGEGEWLVGVCVCVCVSGSVCVSESVYVSESLCV